MVLIHQRLRRTDRQTVRQTTCNRASRGKNNKNTKYNEQWNMKRNIHAERIFSRSDTCWEDKIWRGWGSYFLVQLGIRGNFEGALKRERSTESQEEGSKWCKHDLGSTVELKKLASQLFSAFCEARGSSKEQSTCVRYAVSADVNDVESSFLNSFNLIAATLGQRLSPCIVVSSWKTKVRIYYQL